ncbi:MAG: nitric oxide response protein [Saccharolobus sp.]
MKPGMILLLMGIILLLFAGIPAVLEFMSIQGFPILISFSTQSHWFSMIYGFFLILIGNEVLIALSNEWTRKVAPTPLIVAFGLTTLLANVINFLSIYPLQYYLVLIAFAILLYYSKIYLSPSSLGFQPTAYNYLIFATLIISPLIIAFQSVFDIPWAGLAFPTLMIFAVLSRDIGLVLGGRKINSFAMEIAYAFLAIGLLFYQPLIILAWIFSLYATKLPIAKGRRYPRIALNIAWTWLLISAILYFNYDIFIHAIAVGFLFDTVFGVDAVLMDMIVGITGKRVSLRPSYAPLILLNLGLVMRVIFDLGLNSPILILSAPLQGIGILSFFVLTLRQVLVNKAKY